MTETTDLLIKNDEELDWQRLPMRDELKHRNAGYLGNSLMADMSFYIVSDGVSLPAHKLIVAAGSPVLEKFVHGSGQLVLASPVITVTGISSHGFFEVLRYLYTDTAKLNAENACEILHIAHYYDLAYLEDLCSAKISGFMNVNNVCAIFESMYAMNNLLTDQCLEVIKIETGTLLMNGDLINMRIPALKMALQTNPLNVECELEIFTAMIRWSDIACKRNGVLATGKNMRIQLEGRLDLVRFRGMSVREFGKCLRAVTVDFFTTEEIGDIMLSITQSNYVGRIQSFTCLKPRKSLNYSYTKCTLVTRPGADKLIQYNLPREVCTVQVTEPIWLHGFLVMGQKGFTVSHEGNALDIIVVNKDKNSSVYLKTPFRIVEDVPVSFKIEHDPSISNAQLFLASEMKCPANIYNLPFPRFSKVVGLYYRLGFSKKD